MPGAAGTPGEFDGRAFEFAGLDQGPAGVEALLRKARRVGEPLDGTGRRPERMFDEQSGGWAGHRAGHGADQGLDSGFAG